MANHTYAAGLVSSSSPSAAWGMSAMKAEAARAQAAR